MSEQHTYILGGVRFVIIGGEVYCRYADVFETETTTTDATDDEDEADEELGDPMVPALTNKCGRCGDAGHKSRKCPTRPPYKKPEGPTGAAAHKGPRKCGNCGRPGHTIQSCGRRDPIAEEPLPDHVRKIGAVSRDDFERAKGMQDDGENSIAIAKELGVPITAIGRVMGSETYEEYLEKC